MGMREQVVRMIMRVLWWVGEDVLEPAHPGAQALCRRLEHMFERVGGRSDGTVEGDWVLNGRDAPRGPVPDRPCGARVTRGSAVG